MWYKNGVAYSGPAMGAGWMAEHGYTAEPPAAVALPTERMVDKSRFIEAVIELIPEARRQTVAGDWRTLAAVAQLPGGGVDLGDERVEAFLELAGIDREELAARLNFEEEQ